MGESEQMRGEHMGTPMKQRQAIINKLQRQYLHASKDEKSRILNEFVDPTHLNHSSARRTLRSPQQPLKDPGP